MQPFEKATYRAQVRRLRQLAKNALKFYPVQVKKIEFINHGENTTFAVTAAKGDKYLLRVHRNIYHTLPAIQEELQWLKKLSKEKFVAVPRPIRARNGKLVTVASAPGVPAARHCTMFHWVHGKFLHKLLNEKHLFEIGQIIARLQKAAPTTTHRRYWTAEGLAGNKPKFGSMDSIPMLSEKDQKLVTQTRKQIYRRLKAYEKKFPKRMGNMHADVHFGNLLVSDRGYGVIDFDDSGFGFYVYDLAVTIVAMEYQLGKEYRKMYPKLKTALINGYCSLAPWDKHDEELLPYLITMRKIQMLGWLNSRQDNPKFRRFFKRALKRVKAHLKGTAT